MNCPYCDSTELKLNTTRTTSTGEPRYQYQCLSCSSYHTSPWELGIEPEDIIETFVRDESWIKKILKSKTFVITSAQSNVEVNEDFLSTLESYCKKNKAEFLVVPIKHSVNGIKEHHYPDHIKDYLVENNFKLHDKLKFLGALKINATAENPLTGLTAISKGDSVIVGHNQLQMNTIPVSSDDLPVIMTSTGTLSQQNYSVTKLGYKAGFNHSNSAVVVELDGDLFHIRHLNFDGMSFHDIDKKYTLNTIEPVSIEALVTGDEHALFADPLVKAATYLNKDSIAKKLLPKYIVRHDLLDCYSVSHHHKHSVFTQFAKFQSGTNDVKAELDLTIDHVKNTTSAGAINVIISSNHNDHLTRWLNEIDPKIEPWNAIIYHKLMYGMLSNTVMAEAGASYPNPFELYSMPIFEDMNLPVKFVGRKEVFKIKDIEVANHGDKGVNGSRGSRKQFSQIPSKTIIGHSHSPGIEKGCYQVGTSSYLNLEYNSGPSSWLNTHCIIHANGKRQLINIIKGKWRRS